MDSSTLKWGYSTGGFSDVLPILKSVSSLQNKLDTEKGYSTRGQLTLVITGRDNFKTLIQNNYLKNRRINRKDGFTVSGFLYSDYAQTFSGKILDWSRKGDELTITIGDDMMVDAQKKIPVENSTKTQYLDYRNTNPVDIIQNILGTQLAIPAGQIDTTKFDSEQTNWLSSHAFDRVLTKPEQANKYLNELQMETNSFIIHDGEKITFKVFAPPLPGQTIEEWTDNLNILSGSFNEKSGYQDNFYNRVVVYYDYDESNSDNPENYEAAVIAVDAASQGSSQWSEIKTREVKSKWIRTHTYTQPSNITGVVVYHVSAANGIGTGTLTYNYANNTLQWTAPGGAIGEAIKVSKDGLFQVFDTDKTKWARVIVTTVSLPGGNQTDTITISALQGTTYATFLAQKLLNRYRDPVAIVDMDIDLNNVAYNSVFIKPTDLKDLTTDEAANKGYSTWAQERMLLTSVRPDFSAAKVDIEAIQTKLYLRYGFIAPAGQPDYPSATAAQKERAYIGRASDNKVNAGTEEGYVVW